MNGLCYRFYFFLKNFSRIAITACEERLGNLIIQIFYFFNFFCIYFLLTISSNLFLILWGVNLNIEIVQTEGGLVYVYAFTKETPWINSPDCQGKYQRNH